jgi:hypothetical protein
MAATLVGIIVHRHFVSSQHNRGAMSSATLNLPFTIPCSINSQDALPVYGAFRKHDRELLSKLFADYKFVAVPKGRTVRITNFGATSMVTVEARPPARPSVCFVPADVVPVILQHGSH